MVWQVWHETEKYIQDLLAKFVDHCPKGRMIAELMEKETNTHLVHWVDYISVGGGESKQQELKNLGFNNNYLYVGPNAMAMRHSQADFPRFVVRLSETVSDASVIRVAIRCDSLEEFRARFNCKTLITGSLNGYLARCTFDVAGGHNLIIIERCGCRNILPLETTAPRLVKMSQTRELWLRRERFFNNDQKGMVQTRDLAEEMVSLVGSDLAAAIMLEGERYYWWTRNEAAQVQKTRQDRVGLGWANNDHHTFRSSRENFADLIKIFEKLGFVCRERFYAGEEAGLRLAEADYYGHAKAGWGAQILEHPMGGVIFADVDLAPAEVDIDFAHQPLEPLPNLGTIGLWCGLHGESILQAGMHHLAIRCDFEAIRQELPKLGVKVNEPFTNLDYLKQAFTAGQRWLVDQKRLDDLLAKKMITAEQYQKFATDGAIGSHLGCLQRWGGYKGFHSKGVSGTILETDPRKN